MARERLAKESRRTLFSAVLVRMSERLMNVFDMFSTLPTTFPSILYRNGNSFLLVILCNRYQAL